MTSEVFKILSFSDIINLLLLGVIAWQTYNIKKQSDIMHKQLETSKELEKRNTTVHVLLSWLRTFERNSIIARRILSSLNDNDIKAIHDFNEVDLNNYSDKERIIALIQSLDISRFGEEVKTDLEINKRIHPALSAYIRSLMTEYLNTLEIILLSWNLKIIDRELLEKEFDYLIKEGKCDLDKILQIWDKNKYPILVKFCNTLIEKKKREEQQQQRRFDRTEP